MTDIDHLLGLDTTDPSAALEFRVGVARLAGWTEVEEYRDGTWLGRNPMADNQLLPVIEYERSVDAALTLPLYGTLFYLHRAVDGWLCSIDWRDDDFTLMSVDEKTNTAALAICRAWLRYRRAQSAPVATARDGEA